MQQVLIYQSEYGIEQIYKVQKAAHQPGTYDNTRRGRYADCFVYVLKGSIDYAFEGYQVTVVEGELAYLPKGSRYMMHVAREDAFIYVDFEFDCDLPRRGLGVKFQNGKEEFDRLWVTWKKALPAYHTECRGILYKIYASVIRLFDRQNDIPGALKRKMEKSVEQIVCHYTEQSLSIEKMIQDAELSPTQYRELFQRLFEMSPKQYILKLRMDYAKELLIHTANNIAYIATACGFKDEFYFSAVFKKKCGCAPTEYRRIHSENECVSTIEYDTRR